MTQFNSIVKEYWETIPCGTEDYIVGQFKPYSLEWYEEIEKFRYNMEPMIHSIAQFTRHSNKRVLEIGVGAGTDHLQWARAGAILSGVDLTEAAIFITKERLKLYGLNSDLIRLDAEALPFDDNTFDVVYSWGVIHHSQNPEFIVSEIKRVLKPGGVFLGMFYNLYSIVTFKTWFINCFLKFKPWKSFKYALHNHMESTGTKAYTPAQLRKMFSEFTSVEVIPYITYSDYQHYFRKIKNLLPQSLGWFNGLKVIKKC
jgi:ubiquinone/menaquinone biosynthesis C-methylase UbiE